MASLATRPVQGLVSGGPERAIAGAKVYVMQANATKATSLLTAATGHGADAIGHYVLTDSTGGFAIAGDYACTPGRQVYLYVRGGNSGGSGTNAGIGLMAWLGACPESGNFDKAEPFVFVNEVTTVAAAYAMATRASDATHVTGGGAAEAD
ncbi:MAG: hypothetical protein WBG54_03940, partial [Acidobacteriaceae bacterium]